MDRRWNRHEDTTFAEVAPGIWRLPIELPGHTVGHVNVYALLGRESVTLVDCGWGEDPTWRALSTMLAGCGDSIDRVRRVLVTHFHPDHCGLAGALQRRADAEVGMHRADARHLEDRFVRSERLEAETIAWLRRSGASEAAVESAKDNVSRSASRVVPFAPDRFIGNGDALAIDDWELVALHTPGHTPGHLCFYERRTRSLFSGDHILPFINTSPGCRPHGARDPIGDYLASFPSLRELAVDRVLPGHQRPFTDLGRRLTELEDHHAGRLNATRAVLAQGPATAWSVASRIPRSRDWSVLSNGARISALGEALGHLTVLAGRGEARAEGTAPTVWSQSDTLAIPDLS